MMDLDEVDRELTKATAVSPIEVSHSFAHDVELLCYFVSEYAPPPMSRLFFLCGSPVPDLNYVLNGLSLPGRENGACNST